MTTTITGAAGINRVADGADMPAGSVIQVVNVQTGSLTTGAAQIPLDDTIPQITEGFEFMTLAITPTSASSILRITLEAQAASNGTVVTVGGLFVGTTANALAVCKKRGSADNDEILSLTHTMVAGVATELTFRFRVGTNSSSTVVSLNGRSGARTFGGTCASSITIMEIAQ
jgi:hypothetical protein